MTNAAMKEAPYSPGSGEVFTTDMSVGEILRRSRMHYNQSLQDIERNLRIKAPQIEAIESDRFDLLPGKVYAIGFIRSYSEYLGLDGDKMVRLFKAQGSGWARDPELHFPVCASESKLPSGWVVFGCLVALVGVFAGWNLYSTADRSMVEEIPPVISMKKTVNSLGQVEPASGGNGAGVYGPSMPGTAGGVMGPSMPAPEEMASVMPSTPPAPEVPSATPPAKQGVVLKLVNNCWVEIKDDAGNVLVSRVLKTGERYFIPQRPGLKISLGNAGGVRFQVNGQDLKPVGEDGAVVSNLSLDPEYLVQNFLDASASSQTSLIESR